MLDDTTSNTPSSEHNNDRDNDLAPEIRKVLEKYSRALDKRPEISEPDSMLAQIEHVIYCLMRLAVTMRNPLPFDHFKSRTSDMDHTDDANIQTIRVKHKFSDFNVLPQSLSERFGHANAERLSYFRYRAAHAARFEEGLLEANDEAQSLSEENLGSVMATTEASDLPYHLKDSQNNMRILWPSEQKDDELLSVGTRTSHGTSSGDGLVVQIPRLPPSVMGEPFQCVYCKLFIHVSTEAEWKLHVFADLRPYTCVLEGCSAPQRLFQRRRDWKRHLVQAHWRTWCCPRGCLETFDTADLFHEHFVGSHSTEDSSVGLLLPDQVDHSNFDPDKVPRSCVFCGKRVSSFDAWTSHVGRHLEQVSLFTLPWTWLDDDQVEEETESTGGGSSSDPFEMAAQEERDPPGEVQPQSFAYGDAHNTEEAKIQVHSDLSSNADHLFALHKGQERESFDSQAGEASTISRQTDMAEVYDIPIGVPDFGVYPGGSSYGNDYYTYLETDFGAYTGDPSLGSYNYTYGETSEHYPKEETFGNLPDQYSDPHFQVHPSEYFHPGKVVKVYWNKEQRGNLSASPFRHNNYIHEGPRKMVVFKNNGSSSLVVPISTYGGRGCARRDLRPEEHGIIHDSRYYPEYMEAEPPLGFKPVRMNTTKGKETLPASSRLNYTKVHTLEHNVPVCSIGEVEQDDLDLIIAAVKERMFEDITTSRSQSHDPKTREGKHGKSGNHASRKRR